MPASCEDDLTLTDLVSNPHLAESSRITAGSTSNSNLYGVIDKDKIYGRNLEVPEDAKLPIKPWDECIDEEHFVESGVDDQMILEIPFTQNVRIRSLLLKTGRGDLRPSTCKIYLNRYAIGGTSFDDTSSDTGLKPAQEISLADAPSSSHGGGVAEYPLKVSVFKDVVSLSLFFADSGDGERSSVYYIGFLGDPRNPAKDTDTDLSVAAANAADAPIDGLKETAAPRNSTIR